MIIQTFTLMPLSCPQALKWLHYLYRMVQHRWRHEHQTHSTSWPGNPAPVVPLLNFASPKHSTESFIQNLKPQAVVGFQCWFFSFFFYCLLFLLFSSWCSLISNHGWSEVETKEELRVSLWTTPWTASTCSYIPRCCWSHITSQPTVLWSVHFPCPPSTSVFVLLR